ncbi:DUF2974 domain-containing protein [Lysobacter enzymogenes]|nr:DUF2974 domain-containing protein [Lysobacter enzymogenes]QCW25612.1 DUF2974 domain-containing protein [Lysobacter enzymogenes]
MSQQTEPTAGAQPPQSFADQVRGTQAKPIDKTLSRLMDDLYDQGPGIDGFKPLDAEQLRAKGIDPATLENKDSGFLARIYGDEHGHYVLAYSGTDEGKDWLTNFRQGLGFEDAQYNQAMALAREAKVAFGDEVVITGHSLGGGLAAAASITSGIPAVTFNASGVHDKTLERIGIDADAAKQEMADSGQIRRYAVKNEILTDLQEHSIPLKWAMPDAVGHKIELPDPDPQSFWQKLIPGSGIKHGVDIHYIEAVIKAQEMATPGERGHDAGRAAAATGAREAGRDALADAAHPHNGMYQQALHGLRGLPPGALSSAANRACATPRPTPRWMRAGRACATSTTSSPAATAAVSSRSKAASTTRAIAASSSTNNARSASRSTPHRCSRRPKRRRRRRKASGR